MYMLIIKPRIHSQSPTRRNNVWHTTTVSSLAGDLVQQGLEEMEAPVSEAHTSITKSVSESA